MPDYPDVRSKPHLQAGRTIFAIVLIGAALLVVGALVWSLLQ
jgi:hypothetical protein